MATNNCTRQLRIDKDELAFFERVYPQLLPLFLNRAVLCANRDRKLFEQIFFSPLITDGTSVSKES